MSTNCYNRSSQIEDTPVLCRSRYDVWVKRIHQCRDRPPHRRTWVSKWLAWTNGRRPRSNGLLCCTQQSGQTWKRWGIGRRTAKDWVPPIEARPEGPRLCTVAYRLSPSGTQYDFNFQGGVGVCLIIWEARRIFTPPGCQIWGNLHKRNAFFKYKTL